MKQFKKIINQSLIQKSNQQNKQPMKNNQDKSFNNKTMFNWFNNNSKKKSTNKFINLLNQPISY